MVRNRNFSDRGVMNGKGFGPDNAPGMGRGENSVKLKNPAPKPERGGFDGGLITQPDKSKITSMKKKEFQRRESGRGKGSL